MPSKKRRRRTEEEPESVWGIIAEALAEGVVKTFTNEAHKAAEAFMARQGTNVPVAAEDSKTKPEPVVDNATTDKPDDSDTIIEGEYKYVD